MWWFSFMRPRISSDSDRVLPFLYGRSLPVSASKMSAIPMQRACTDICSRVRPSILSWWPPAYSGTFVGCLGDLEVALEHLEARVDKLHAVENGRIEGKSIRLIRRVRPDAAGQRGLARSLGPCRGIVRAGSPDSQRQLPQAAGFEPSATI